MGKKGPGLPRAFHLMLLDNDKGVYRSGDVIHGEVAVEFLHTYNLKGIVVEFSGAAEVHITIRNQGHRNKTEYFNEKMLLYGTDADTDTITMTKNPFEHPQGQFSYPFQFQLPQNLPNSMEIHKKNMHNDFGRIRYVVTAKITHPWKESIMTVLPFTVIADYDLNKCDMAMEPLLITKASSNLTAAMDYLTGKSTDEDDTMSLEATLQLSRMGYVPGDSIILSGKVENNTDASIYDIKLRFKMTTMLIAETYSRLIEKTIENITLLGEGHLVCGRQISWTGEDCPIPVPPVPPTGFANCDFIENRYYIVLTVLPNPKTKGLERIECQAEIVIGTIPVREPKYGNYIFYEPPEGPSAIHSTRLQLMEENPELTLYPQPEYLDYYFGKTVVRYGKDKTKKDSHGYKLEWSPKYIFYKRRLGIPPAVGSDVEEFTKVKRRRSSVSSIKRSLLTGSATKLINPSTDQITPYQASDLRQTTTGSGFPRLIPNTATSKLHQIKEHN